MANCSERSEHGGVLFLKLLAAWYLLSKGSQNHRPRRATQVDTMGFYCVCTYLKRSRLSMWLSVEKSDEVRQEQSPSFWSWHPHSPPMSPFSWISDSFSPGLWGFLSIILWLLLSTSHYAFMIVWILQVSGYLSAQPDSFLGDAFACRSPFTLTFWDISR